MKNQAGNSALHTAVRHKDRGRKAEYCPSGDLEGHMILDLCLRRRSLAKWERCWGQGAQTLPWESGGYQLGGLQSLLPCASGPSLLCWADLELWARWGQGRGCLGSCGRCFPLTQAQWDRPSAWLRGSQQVHASIWNHLPLKTSG